MNLKLIQKAASSPKLTIGERSLLKWQLRSHSAFGTALWKAISQADTENLSALEKGFPCEVMAWRGFLNGSLRRKMANVFNVTEEEVRL